MLSCKQPQSSHRLSTVVGNTLENPYVVCSLNSIPSGNAPTLHRFWLARGIPPGWRAPQPEVRYPVAPRICITSAQDIVCSFFPNPVSYVCCGFNGLFNPPPLQIQLNDSSSNWNGEFFVRIALNHLSFLDSIPRTGKLTYSYMITLFIY